MSNGKISGDLPIPNIPSDALIPLVWSGGNYSNSIQSLTHRIDVRYYNVLAANSAATNATNLQSLIDASTANGAELYFCEPIYCDPIELKSNVHLVGNNPSAFKGSTPNGGGSAGPSAIPAGATFLITNTSTAFCMMHSNTSVEGFVVYYPNQVMSATSISGTTTYPATFIRPSGSSEGQSLRRICFVGATKCISFLGTNTTSDFVADLEFDLLYAYPLGGVFMELAFVADIPRITRCHINPGVGFQFLGDAGSGISCPVKSALISDCIQNGGIAFTLNVADDFMISQSFVYGQLAGFWVNNSYGRLEGCATDTCATGLRVTFATLDYKSVTASDHRGLPSLNGNAFHLDGAAKGCFSLSNCNAFSGYNSNAFLKSAGSGAQLIQLSNCSYSNSAGGTFANGVQNSNGSATVSGSVTSY